MLVKKSNIFNLVKSSDLNTKLPTLVTKAELKPEEDNIAKLEVLDSSYFHDKNIFGDDGFKNIFVYQ